MKSPRFWVIFLLLAATGLLLYGRGSAERTVASEPLSQIPDTIAGWTGVDQPIDPETLEVLGRGDFLSRVYTKAQEKTPIGLFVGYFPSQRTGVTIHSPKHCLPGAGWAFESSEYATLTGADGRAHKVGEYIISNGDHRQFVIYWYQAHGRSIANEYMAKVYLVADAIRMNRTDGALVRVIAPIEPNDGVPGARVRAETFTEQIFPLLPRFIPN
jgi:EpsI family protein